MNEPLVLTGLERSFKTGDRDLHILRGVDLTLHAGEIVGLVGPSGAGKSSLLHAAGLLERPSAGRVLVQGIDGWGLSERARTDLRRDSLGFVYQFHHLLPEFSALENVAMPMLIAGHHPSTARARAGDLLDLVGLAQRKSHRPAQLSGGEQQRVAIARALANRPGVLLADEPTGNLDPHTAEEVFEALRRIVHEQNVSALIATHNLEVAARCDRVLALSDGLLTPRA